MLFDFDCTACKFGRGTTVPGEGPTDAKLVVISDYPGIMEAKERRPFVGTSGKLLRAALENIVELDLKRDVYFTNVIKCQTMKEKVTPKELNTCKKWLGKELKLVTPKVILVCGEQAKNALLPKLEGGVSANHGLVLTDQLYGWKIMVTWNPAAVEQYSSFDPDDGSREFKTGSVPWMFLRDMEKLKALLEETYGT